MTTARPRKEFALTMSVIFGVSSDVLENEGAGGCHNKDLEHEIVERFKKDGAEALGFKSFTVVVTKCFGP